MSKRNDFLLIGDIKDSIEKILRYTEGMDFEDFDSNELVVDAVIRNFEIIGEAANHLSRKLKADNPQIN